MEIINRSKFDIAISNHRHLFIVSPRETYIDHFYSFPLNLYIKDNENLILIKKVTEFCNRIIIKGSLIENEVEVEIAK